MSKIKIGWAEVDITPSENIALAGQFYERVSNQVETTVSLNTSALMLIQNLIFVTIPFSPLFEIKCT